MIKLDKLFSVGESYILANKLVDLTLFAKYEGVGPFFHAQAYVKSCCQSTLDRWCTSTYQDKVLETMAP